MPLRNVNGLFQRERRTNSSSKSSLRTDSTIILCRSSSDRCEALATRRRYKSSRVVHNKRSTMIAGCRHQTRLVNRLFENSDLSMKSIRSIRLDEKSLRLDILPAPVAVPNTAEVPVVVEHILATRHCGERVE